MDPTTRAAYETLERLDGIEDDWACEEAEREGRQYWETPPRPKPKPERGLDTALAEFSEPRKATPPADTIPAVFTETQVDVIGAALSEIRKQVRDEVAAEVTELHGVLAELRSEVEALRGEVTRSREEVTELRCALEVDEVIRTSQPLMKIVDDAA